MTTEIDPETRGKCTYLARCAARRKGGAVTLTPKGINALKGRPEAFEVRDGTGLFVRVLPNGRKVFKWTGPPCKCRPTPHRHGVTLGDFGDGVGGTVTLAQARAQLDDLRAAGPLTAEGASVRTVADLARVFYKESLVRRRVRHEAAWRTLEKDVIATIGAVPIARFDVQAANRPAAAAMDRGAVTHAGTVNGLVKQMGKWGMLHGYLKSNPAAALDDRDIGVVKNQRKRWLTAEELSVFLPAIDVAALEKVTRLALKLLLCTALRTNELITLRWVDVDLGEKVLRVRPENLTLNLDARRKADVYTQPLSALAVSYFTRLQELTGERDYCFASRSERLDDKALGHAVRRMGEANKTLAEWPKFTPHDIRGSVATWISETLGDELGAQRVLGHSLSRLTGSSVAGAYDLSKGVEHKRGLLDSWGLHLQQLAAGKSAPVVAPKRKRARA